MCSTSHLFSPFSHPRSHLNSRPFLFVPQNVSQRRRSLITCVLISCDRSFTNGKKVSFGKAGASGSGQVPRVAPRLRDQHIGEVFARLAQRKEAQRDEEQRIRTSGSGRPLKRRKLEVITIDSSPERGRSLANPIHIESSPQAVPQPVVENVLVESSPDVIPSAPVNTGRPSKGKGRVAGLPIPPTVTHDGAGPSSMAKGKGRVIEPSPVRHRDIGSSRVSPHDHFYK